MIYTHVLNRGGRGVRSPADALSTETSVPGATVPEDAAISTGNRLTGPRSLTRLRMVDEVGLNRAWRKEFLR